MGIIVGFLVGRYIGKQMAKSMRYDVPMSITRDDWIYLAAGLTGMGIIMGGMCLALSIITH